MAPPPLRCFFRMCQTPGKGRPRLDPTAKIASLNGAIFLSRPYFSFASFTLSTRRVDASVVAVFKLNAGGRGTWASASGARASNASARHEFNHESERGHQAKIPIRVRRAGRMAEAWSITSVTPLLAAPLEAARRLRQGAAEVASEPQPPRQPYANAAAHRLLLGALLLSMTGVVALALRVEPSSEVPGRGTPLRTRTTAPGRRPVSSSTPSDARGSKSDTVVSAAAGGAAASRASASPTLCS